jgi:3-hydroxyisobutyrate dehydrogenase-like beta-hydroxyacid dehydrogenase
MTGAEEAGVTTVSVLHPGSMGVALGRSLIAAGVTVRWAAAGRSGATVARARAAGFEDVDTLQAACESDVVVSICPPGAALAVAESVAALGFAGVYLDANAIAPTTAEEVDAIVSKGGASYVDGSVIGGPDAPRLFHAGASAPTLAPRFGAPATVEVLAGPRYGASALKMVYAGWSKGTTALLLALAAGAEALGVRDVVEAEWARSQPALGPRLHSVGPSAAKAWRWSDEMREISATLATVGLPGQFHDGAALVYERLAALKDDPDATIDTVIHLLPSRT